MPEIDAGLAARLIEAQFPHWAGLPLVRFEPAGSDNVVFRLGDTMAVRLPRGDWAAGQARKEHAWLPRLAAGLPLPTPAPLGLGRPAFGYPWHWSVARWLEGSAATPEGFAEPERTAIELAHFLRRLRAMPPAHALAPGPHPELAPVPLAERYPGTREAIAALAGVFDAAALTEIWEAALAAPAWAGEPVWYHGDFHTGNLLVRDGRLSAVIDFGGLGMGDPAPDLMIAYTLLTAGTRRLFRAALGVDDATWARGLGWALGSGLSAHVAYAATHPHIAAATHRQISEVLAEHAAPTAR
ncbi:aminoglycoside phosphotransferase family protein [Streptomyces hoynatensis]|uniref:Aminoglycoside phosphotransferase family protein n=1 Tax=Streptomyces hoynatensis TaxID=1141874 RepID=A0A3A9Z2S4_9ACTN|nr:aminoglycoside phosphotransferase family protein [Streptomyces hoynatensis]RKN42505.1 aminoglycoside phosphotransferase family protein [Streptomyces hoynatensis]